MRVQYIKTNSQTQRETQDLSSMLLKRHYQNNWIRVLFFRNPEKVYNFYFVFEPEYGIVYEKESNCKKKNFQDWMNEAFTAWNSLRILTLLRKLERKKEKERNERRLLLSFLSAYLPCFLFYPPVGRLRESLCSSSFSLSIKTHPLNMKGIWTPMLPSTSSKPLSTLFLSEIDNMLGSILPACLIHCFHSNGFKNEKATKLEAPLKESFSRDPTPELISNTSRNGRDFTFEA